jgi:hypothetical protein
MPLGLRKTNHYAVAGFLLPFMTAALACIVVLFGFGSRSLGFWLLFLAVIPLLLCAGLLLSLKSIPLISELGDKDYAYSGLVLNIFFMLIYIYALLYLHFFMK